MHYNNKIGSVITYPNCETVPSGAGLSPPGATSVCRALDRLSALGIHGLILLVIHLYLISPQWLFGDFARAECSGRHTGRQAGRHVHTHVYLTASPQERFPL